MSLLKIFGGKKMNSTKSMKGKNVIVRTYSAGVHYGTLEEQEGQEVALTNARRLWYWKGAFTLSEIATKGIDKRASKLSVAVPQIVLTQAIEIIPVSEEAETCLNEVPAYEC